MFTLENIEQNINNSYPAPEACWYRIDRNWADIKAIVWHYTGVCFQTAEANAQYYAGTGRADDKVGAHYFVDGNSIYSSTPWNQRAGHCGDKGVGTYKQLYNNNNTIGIENCPCHTSGKKYPAATEKGWFFTEKTMENLIVLTAWLLKKIRSCGGDAVIIRHYDVTQKWCPAPFCENESLFIKCRDRAYALADTSSAPSTGSVDRQPETDTSKQSVFPLSGTLKIIYTGIDGVNVRTAPSMGDSFISKAVHNGTYTVVGISADKQWYRLASGLYISTNSNLVQFSETAIQPSYHIPYIGKVNAADGLNLRRTADSSQTANILTLLPENTYVAVTKEQPDGWVYCQTVIKKKCYKGYVYKKYLTSYDENDFSKRKVTDKTGLNIRAGGSMADTIVATMPPNAVFMLLDTGKDWGLVWCGETLGYAGLSDKYSVLLS